MNRIKKQSRGLGYTTSIHEKKKNGLFLTILGHVAPSLTKKSQKKVYLCRSVRQLLGFVAPSVYTVLNSINGETEYSRLNVLVKK